MLVGCSAFAEGLWFLEEGSGPLAIYCFSVPNLSSCIFLWYSFLSCLAQPCGEEGWEWCTGGSGGRSRAAAAPRNSGTMETSLGNHRLT